MTPLKIWQFWHDGQPPPPLREWVREWEGLHRSPWGHVLHDADTARTFLSTYTPDLAYLWDQTPDRYPNDVWRQRADILRCGLLHVAGGIWLDTDMEPLGQRLDVLRHLGPTLCWEADGTAAIGLIAAPANSDYLTRVRDGMPAAFARKHPRTKHSDNPIGPHYWSSLLGPDVTVLASQVCYPYGWRDQDPGTYPDSLMVHHWHSAPNKRVAV